MTSSKPSEAEKKSAGYRYGREEMLAMYAPALPIPDDVRDMTIFCTRELLPVSFLPLTEDEQNALLKCVNSELSVRSNQREPAQSQGARGAAGGVQKRGRGRGRSDVSVRSAKTNDGRSETSESQGSVDWRKEKLAEKSGGGSNGGNAVARAPSKSNVSGSSDENYESDEVEEVQAVQCSDRLSYTAPAPSLPEDVSFNTANVRDRCIIANSINRVVNYSSNLELLDRHQHQPTTAMSYNSVVSTNASMLAPSGDMKLCGGDVRQPSVGFAKGRTVDTSALSAYGEGFCGDVGRTNPSSDGMVSSNPMFGRVSQDGWQNGLWTEERVNAETWFYKDPNGEIQGPFRSREMADWFLMGYFPMKLHIRPSRAEQFVLLGDLIKAYGRVPFLSRTEEKDVPPSHVQSASTDHLTHHPSRPASVLPFHQQFIPPSVTYSAPSFPPKTPLQLNNQRMETHLSSATSVVSQDSGWPFVSTGSLNTHIEGNPLATVDREKIEEDLKKRIEKQLKEKLMLEMEREKLRLEQLKIEEERRLMIEHHHLLEDEKRRQEERRKMEEERRHLEEERRKLEELHRRAEEERRQQEHLRSERQREEQEMRMIEEERKMVVRERRELEELRRKTEGDRRAIQLLQELSDDSIDEGTIVSEGKKEDERFGGSRMWKTDAEKAGGDGKLLMEEFGSAMLEPSDEGRLELREDGAEVGVEAGAMGTDKGPETSDCLEEEMHGLIKEPNCVEKCASASRSAQETKKKLVAWNSSSKSEAEKQCTPTSPAVKCPWGAAASVPPIASQPLTETPDVVRAKTFEEDVAEAQKKLLNAIQQEKKQMTFNWNELKSESSAQQSKVQSFLEIQNEQAKQEKEDEKKRKQQQQQQQQQQIGKVPIKMKPQNPPPPPPRRIRAAAAAKENSSVEQGGDLTGVSTERMDSVPTWAVEPKSSVPSFSWCRRTSSSMSSLLGVPCVPDLMSVSVLPSVSFPHPQPWNPTTGPPMSAAAEMNEFMVWCHRALPTTNSSIDATTLIDFLKDVESPYELYDYVRLYLGESKQSTDFAHEFLERRKRLQMRMNRSALGFCFTPVYPSIAFGYQTNGMFY